VQIADLLASSLRKHFDSAIGVIPHPASDSEDMCLSLDEPAKTDALYAAAYEKSARLKTFA